jgi:alpha-galactosidase
MKAMLHCSGNFKIWKPGGSNPTTPPPTNDIKLGDVNGDGNVNAGDYTLMRRYLLGNITEFTVPNGEVIGDVNKDGQINAGDYTLLRRYILGLVDSF